jgi:hypothetical protein
MPVPQRASLPRIQMVSSPSASFCAHRTGNLARERVDPHQAHRRLVIGDLGRRRQAGHLHRPAGAGARPGAGLPAELAEALAGADLGLGRGELLTGPGDLGRLIRRPTTPWPAQSPTRCAEQGSRHQNAVQVLAATRAMLKRLNQVRPHLAEKKCRPRPAERLCAGSACGPAPPSRRSGQPSELRAAERNGLVCGFTTGRGCRRGSTCRTGPRSGRAPRRSAAGAVRRLRSAGPARGCARRG